MTQQETILEQLNRLSDDIEEAKITFKGIDEQRIRDILNQLKKSFDSVEVEYQENEVSRLTKEKGRFSEVQGYEAKFCAENLSFSKQNSKCETRLG